MGGWVAEPWPRPNLTPPPPGVTKQWPAPNVQCLLVNPPQDNLYIVKQQKYKLPAKYSVECDASSSTYPLCIAAITVCVLAVTLALPKVKFLGVTPVCTAFAWTLNRGPRENILLEGLGLDLASAVTG